MIDNISLRIILVLFSGNGKKLHVSLTKDEVKDRYERDSPPLPAEFESNEYKDITRQREAKYPQYRELIPLMAKEYGFDTS